MNIGTYYESGSYGTIDTTMLSFADGHMLDDNYIDLNDVEGRGVLLTRGMYTLEGRGDRYVINETPFVVLGPEELERVAMVTVDGKPLLLKLADGSWAKPIIGMVDEMRGDADMPDLLDLMSATDSGAGEEEA